MQDSSALLAAPDRAGIWDVHLRLDGHLALADAALMLPDRLQTRGIRRCGLADLQEGYVCRYPDMDHFKRPRHDSLSCVTVVKPPQHRCAGGTHAMFKQIPE